MYVLQELLRKTIEMKASDLHLTVGLPPTIRYNGKLIHLGDGNYYQMMLKSFLKKYCKKNMRNI